MNDARTAATTNEMTMGTSDTPTPTQKSSVSKLMVNGKRSAEVLKLGQKIVDELGLDQTVDTLGRWMAHYVAERIKDVEAASGEDRSHKMSVCADAILRLWTHRSKLPDGRRPFEGFEPVFQALESLNLDNGPPRYFRQLRSAINKETEASETKTWLDLVSSLDFSARLLIRYCLAMAAESAVDSSREWVALATEATAGDDLEIRIIRYVARDADDLAGKRPEDLQKEKIKEYKKRLNTFRKLAEDLDKHFDEILAQ